MKRTALILGIEPRITIPIARSLHRNGVAVHVASLSPADHSLQSIAIADFVSLPDSEKFLEEFIRLISQRQYDSLIPATDAALDVISRHEAHLRPRLRVACPSAPIVQRVLNKSITLDFARRAGICVPQSLRVQNAVELQKLSNQLRFPLVAKPYHKSGETDFKVRYFPTYDSLHKALTEDDQLGSRILLQEFAAGDGVGVEVLMHQAQSVAIFQHRRLKEVPATGGAAAVAVSEAPDPYLVDQALALLRALEWEGVAMVEFRYDRESRRSALMEVNGRYWGTLALPIQAGVDFPWYEWQIAHGEQPSVLRNYKIGVRWRWSTGYVRRWHGLAKGSIKKAFRRPTVLKELLPSLSDLTAHDALWDSADPMAALTDVLRGVRQLAVSDISAALKIARGSRANHVAVKSGGANA